MTKNIFEKISSSFDLTKIEELIAGIVGDQCWDAYIGYGSSVVLYIRTKTLYLCDYGENKIGEWIFNSMGTTWYIYSPFHDSSDLNDATVTAEQLLPLVKGAVIISFKITYPDLRLSIKFSNGFVVSITPSSEDESVDIAYWTLITPDNMFLEVGPGNQWSYNKADEPIDYPENWRGTF